MTDAMGKRLSWKQYKNHVLIQFEQGEADIAVLRKDIVNVFLPYETKEHRSKAIEGEKAVDTPYTAAEDGEALVISTEALTVKVYDGFAVDFYRPDGTLLCADYRGRRTVGAAIDEEYLDMLRAEGHDVSDMNGRHHKIQVVKVMDGDEKFYGLGDKTGFLNKRHYEYENWNSDIPQAHNEDYRALYKSVPFLITLKKQGVFGLFFDNTYHSYLNLGKENPGYYFYGVDKGNLDYYFIAGDKMTDIVSGYTYLTGTTPLPQRWTLGYHQSRWGYESAGEIRDVAKHYRALQIPCDTIHFDIDYMDGYRVFTWNEEAFGKPGEIIRELAQDGFHAVTIIDPGVKKDEGYAVYDEGIAEGYFAKDVNGQVYVNEVWPGEAVYPDFGNPTVREWWAKKQGYLVNLGVSGVWNDMNEPASFRGELPQDVVFTDEDRPSTHAAMHNVYGHLMAKATYEGLLAASGRRPFVITRACYAGSQKYSTVWTGDNQSLWAHLQMAVPQLSNLGLSGIAFAGTDIGGFGADCTEELLCRWIEMAAFSPLCRNHSSKGSVRQEPWQFGETCIAVYRKFLELRYRLIPYLYDLFHVCEETGLPILRPLVLHYQDDKETWNLNGEFLVGENLLVAPVLEQGAVKKMVYLPEGIWYGFETKERYEGGNYYLVDAPLDVCPMFVKEGTILPTYEVRQAVGEQPYHELKLMVFPGSGSYVHYQDNGCDFAYRDGAYNLYRFTSAEDGTVKTQLLHKGYEVYDVIK